MCDDIFADVAGCRVASLPAEIEGYRRCRVKGEEYPALRPEGPGRVRGVVYQGLPRCAWTRLDVFEGQMYRRQAVHARVEDGRVIVVETYVFRPAYLALLESREWDYEEFLRTGKARFMAQYRGYGDL